MNIIIYFLMKRIDHKGEYKSVQILFNLRKRLQSSVKRMKPLK